MIGYYVHHRGRGHLHRALCVARHTDTPVTGLSSLPRPERWPGAWVRLPLDTGDGGAPEADATANGRLHWVPTRHRGLRDRMGAIADWTARTAPSLFVSDVSVEVALLARLLGVPVVVAAMRGDRSDAAHRLGYDIADALLAPWPADLPEPGWPSRWSAKTVHTGAFSRYDGRHDGDRAGSRAGDGRRRVLVVQGAGGSDLSDAQLTSAAAASPGWRWDVLGGPGRPWDPDPWPRFLAADVVVTHAGQNAVAECAAARRPAVVIPQDRPHDEQRATARALHTAGLAVVRPCWPPADEWPQVLDLAVRTGQRWDRWAPGDGARHAALLLDRLAARTPEADGLCV
ncbi:glycosyltransferase [uncultured Streptomyces sp.]|uniref:glycosyltransferase n=1 Tax=uncultured Streptomyces sp. TaxID=174707 RepID=UPI002614B1C8|nr:glycosyltransferase [uncultured Streptomyces sp.]